jgi:hypothetical protein
VLTNSAIQIPVSISLDRSVAQRLNLAGTTPLTNLYAKLPDFLTIKGTLGDPKRDINVVALGGAVLQGVGGKAGQAGGALQGLGGILGGAPQAGTNAAGTNLTGNLLRGLGGLLAPGANTNQPGTNKTPLGDLLDLLPKKK